MVKKKVLLMGKQGSGKTSMRSIIFANYIARDTSALTSTIMVEASHMRFLGNLTLHLWDCGGQEAFMENYFTSQKDHIFRNVAVLIYVFDVESRDAQVQKDMSYFKSCMEAIAQYSTEAKIFCLLHKMDLLNEEQGEKLFRQRDLEFAQIALPMKITSFKTSIWDETLYLAWSSIVYSLIPNVKELETSLRNFLSVCECHEVVLFERATFLVICHADSDFDNPDSNSSHHDVHRFEKISNIIKQFKLSCTKCLQARFQSMEVRNSNFSAFIDVLTNNTYIMVIMSDPSIQSTAINLNIKLARPHFEKYLQANDASGQN